MAIKACLLVLAFASAAMANPGYTGPLSEPLYTLQAISMVNNSRSRMDVEANIALAFSEQTDYEWEGYDGWFNNPSHPDWGGADMPLERKTPTAYPDGVYEIVNEETRANVLVIANLTQNGVTGRGSVKRTAFFTFFGQQVVEEILDAQRPGCIPEYEDMRVPKCHPLFDPDCRSDRYIPFLRSRYDFRTGYSPSNPRNQLNEITPWMDGTLVYGPFKAWTDALRSFTNGTLAAVDNTVPISEQFPRRNDFGLPLANPPPPVNNSFFPVNRFWTIGNPRGDENPFLLTMGILWFRVHQYWAEKLYKAHEDEKFKEDEWIFNRARQFTIATYQHVVYNNWLPLFIPRMFRATNGSLPAYDSTPGYSAYGGYNPAINPQVAHIFQSAAMRFGHTIVTPGVWRRELRQESTDCFFGPTLSETFKYSNSFLKRISPTTEFNSWDSIIENFGTLPMNATDEECAINQIINATLNLNLTNYGSAPDNHFAVRTCNSFWNPQVTVSETNVDPFYLGMASQRTEREDNIITPDLRGKVFGPFDFTRRDLMAVNMQRARDHGLPDYNQAREAYNLPRIERFEDINPLYGVDATVTSSLESLRAVYNNDIDRCDIWVCGMAETIPSEYDMPGSPLEDMSGPGDLFSTVLFDQFMRVRHADRFWYENYKFNGIFTQEEIASIRRLDIKQLLILTTNIRNEDLGPSPFLVEGQVCPQPFQLSELYMDDCSGLENFDYYTTSDYEIPIVWGFVFLAVGLVILVMIMMAAYNQHRRAQLYAVGKSTRAKKIDGDDIVSGEGEVMVAWELKAGLKEEKRQVSMKTGPGKRLVLYSEDTVLREIDLRSQTQITFERPFDDTTTFVLKFPNEYDIVIQCLNAIDRTTFLDRLESYFNDIGIGHTLIEPKKKLMLNQVFTKKQRQKLLENFFKSVFREGGQVQTGDIGESRSNILECELSRAEFADAMSLKPDSLFIEQMFQLIDQDGNGFVSFREFLDMIVIFAKGSPEDKIKLMFDMYDVDKSGVLDRIEFKKMLKAMMEMVNAKVSSEQMEQLVDSMFASAGFQNKQDLTLEDFNILLRDHKEQLSNAHLNVSGFDVPDIEIDKKAEEETEAVPSRYRARETAPARARRTIIRAYGRTGKGAKKEEEVESSPAVDIPVKTKSSFSKTSLGRKWAVFIRYIENYKLHIFYLSIFFLVTACIFVERSYYYSVEREHAGLRRIAGYGVTVTRGAASGMMWAYSVLLLTMARNFITYFRETIFNYYIPFDSYIAFHKIVALTALFFTFMHAIGHGINFYHISTQTANDLTCIFREVYHRTHVLPKFTYWLFLTMTGFAGFMVSLITVVIFVFATQYARRYTFQAFWVTHHWYVIFYILSFLHGSGRLVQDPLFGNFFLGPGIIYAVDLLISVGRRKAEVAVVRADILPSLVVGVYFKRPLTFDYKPGQWVKIASAAQNPGEFHSFTLSSAPHEEFLSLHIRSVGPWTYNFRDHYNPANLRGQPYPKLYLDGPFGEGHQDWNKFEVAVLVGGGIGVTPFSSILKELVHRFNIGAKVECKKVFFIWVTRTQKQYEWFSDIIQDVEEADKKGLVENHIFVTQFFDKFDLRTTMLYICERHFQKLSGKSLFTGLRAITHFGRPDFNQFFDNLQEEYILLPSIGVFSCGPPGMTTNVDAACAATNRFEGPPFHHHFENF